MTINANIVKSGPYTGTNTTATYNYTFRIQNAAEIVVRETDLVGVETLLVEGTDFSVTGVGNNGGGTVIRTAGNLPTGFLWLIWRDTPGTQATDLVSQGSFVPQTHENALDKLETRIQELEDAVNRSIRVEMGGVDLTEFQFGAAGLSGKFPQFQANGNIGLASTATLLQNPATTFASMATIATLQGSTSTTINAVFVEGWGAAGDGGGGWFVKDPADILSADNGGTIIVDSVVPTATRWKRQYHGIVDVVWFGAFGDGIVDETTNIQDAWDVGDGIYTAPTKEYRVTNTLNFGGVTASGFLPQINSYGQFNFDLVANDREAIIIGDATDVFSVGFIRISAKADVQSPWTNVDNKGIVIRNSNSSFIDIRRADNFRYGVVPEANLQGFQHNFIILGHLVNNQYGLWFNQISTGFINENNWHGGRCSVFDAVNPTLERWGMKCGTTGTSNAANNNRFWGPSFEMNLADTGVGFTHGILFENATQNYVDRPRSEGTETLFEEDIDSSENYLIAGLAGSDSATITRPVNTPFGSVTLGSRPMAQYASKMVFHVPSLLERYSIDASGNARFSGMVIRRFADGLQNVSLASTIRRNDAIEFGTAGQILGVMVDTSVDKEFILSLGYQAGSAGSRTAVICFDSAGATLTGAAPAHVNGATSNLFAVDNDGYKTGGQALSPIGMRFHDDVKKALIGFTRGTPVTVINSFRLYAVDQIGGMCDPQIIQEAVEENSPTMKYSSGIPTIGTWKHPTILFDVVHAASGKMGLVLVDEGTFSSATDGTGDTDGATGVITGMSDTSDFFVGDMVLVSAGFAASNIPYEILAVTATTVTLEVLSTSGETNITVATVDPVFKPFGAIDA